MFFFVSRGGGQWFFPAQSISAFRCEACGGTAGCAQLGIVVCLGVGGRGNLHDTVFGAGSFVGNIVPGVILGRQLIRDG